ncbi:hypothetical protein GF323_05010 [Candidatus Woesearchaeota archaeon]|nr:hypothetical protein [Candidatus Woesearchaeota archaeon]
MKIGILTSGGDTQSLNAIIHGAAETAELYNNHLVGFMRGWKGVLSPISTKDISKHEINPAVGGTILKSSRTNPDDNILKVAAYNIEHTVDALIAVGGDDSLTVGKKLLNYLKIPVCFVTKTIDNDVGKNASADGSVEDIINYFNPGFPSAARYAINKAQSLRTTAYSHDRIIFMEAMGRTPGWLALSSYRGNPDMILVPEAPIDYEHFLAELEDRYAKEENAVVVVAEGVRYKGRSSPIREDAKDIDEHGHKKLGGVAKTLSARVKEDLKISRVDAEDRTLMYRSGSPTCLDRQTSMYLGKIAARTVIKGTTGQVAVLQRYGDDIRAEVRPIENVLDFDNMGRIIPRNIDPRFYDKDNYCITQLGKKYFEVINR